MAGTRQVRRMSARTTRRSKERFLAAYARLGNATAVQNETGISRYHHKHWLKTSAEYRRQFELADDAATEVLEQEARRRAVEGREEPIFYNGQQVGTVRKYSDYLLVFLLKSKRPDVYRETFNTRINNNLNVQTAVKVIHEYHDSPPQADITALETLPNKHLMAATDSVPFPQPITELTEAKVGSGPVNPSYAQGTSQIMLDSDVPPDDPTNS